MQTNNDSIKFIVLQNDLIDGKIIRAKKDIDYQVTFEDDDAIYFIAENELVCGLSKAVQTHPYKILYKENKI